MTRPRDLARRLLWSVELLLHVADWRGRLILVAYLVRRTLGRVSRDRTLTVRMRDITMTFTEGSSELTPYLEIVIHGIYDRNTDLVPAAGSTVVDVGANIGIFTVVQARRGAKVVAIEPHPGAFGMLVENVRQNHVAERVVPVNSAIGRTAGTAWLDDRQGTVSAHLAPRSEHGHDVRVTPLDPLIAELGLGHVDLLKVDVEGAELEVLAGAQRTLGTTAAVFIEVHGDLLPRVAAVMNGHGFVEAAGGNGPNRYFVRPSRSAGGGSSSARPSPPPGSPRP